MIRYLTLLFLCFTLSFSKEYPNIYSQLGTPLFEAIKPVSELSDISPLKKSSAEYVKQAKEVLAFGYKADTSKNKNDKKSYLMRLRKLQKKYDYLLHKIDENINSSIDKKDYELFLRLTDYEFKGLFKSQALLDKSIAFYEKNSKKKKSATLDKQITFLQHLVESQQEVFNTPESDTFDSSSKKTSSKKSVYISLKKRDGYVIFYAHNKNFYDVTLKVNAVYTNNRQDQPTSKVFVVKANETKEYERVLIRNNANNKYKFSYSWIIGSKYAVHDDSYLYRLPYAKGTSHKVTQGFNGSRTHTGHSRYAVDFDMKKGTRVYAAREGIVVKTKSDSNKVGWGEEFAKYGNHITIVHSDSTFGTYYHLRKNGVAKQVGDRVRRGEFIGYSGNTGYSSGPHLHFAVFKAKNEKETASLPIKFISSKGVIKRPKEGVFYKAK